MRAYIPPVSFGAPASVEMEAGDQFSLILAEMSLPYLRQRLADVETGRVPFMDLGDIPLWLRPADEGQDEVHADGCARERWAYILAEMIWAMEATLDWTNRRERHVIERGETTLTPSPKHLGAHDLNVTKRGVIDSEGVRSDGERLREGHRLFARYVRAI